MLFAMYFSIMSLPSIFIKVVVSILVLGEVPSQNVCKRDKILFDFLSKQCFKRFA